jgi:hypothetical protein
MCRHTTSLDAVVAHEIARVAGSGCGCGCQRCRSGGAGRWPVRLRGGARRRPEPTDVGDFEDADDFWS